MKHNTIMGETEAKPCGFPANLNAQNHLNGMKSYVCLVYIMENKDY